MKFEMVLFALAATANVHAIELLAATDHFSGENQLVNINSTTGTFTPVIKNFSVWDIPDAAFDSVNNILYACTRLRPQSDELSIIAYDRTGAKLGKRVRMNKDFAPDNLGAPYFDEKLQKLIMLYQPYDKQTELTMNQYVEVDPKTGTITKSINVSTKVITSDWELCMESSAYDPINRIMYQFWDVPNNLDGRAAPGQTLSAVNLDTGVLSHLETKLPLGGFLSDPVFCGEKIYGFDQKGFLVSVDPKTGSLATVSKVALAHNIAPWYPTLFKADATSPQLLYVSNTTNGGGARSVSRGRASQKMDKYGRRFRVSPYMMEWEQRREEQLANRDRINDDDGFIHTHSSLVGFDLESGKIVDGPVPLAAPVTWMSALDSSA
jgi:hypothetical protein